MIAPPMPADAARYAADVVLRDGGSIHLRAIRRDDRARLREHFHRLSAPSVYFRFFGGKRRLSEEELTRFTVLDFPRSSALVATHNERLAARMDRVVRLHDGVLNGFVPE